MGIRPFAIVILVAIALISPPAAATHWTLYHQGMERSVGATTEDDFLVYDSPTEPHHGIVNKVNRLGEPIGAGGLFLDARVGNQIGSPFSAFGVGGEGIEVHPSGIFNALFGRPDLLLPTTTKVSSWYGWWNDLDNDGIIDDIHDGAAAPQDEFLWRGKASGETVGIVFSQYGDPKAFTDRTALSNAEQGWVSDAFLAIGEGFLFTRDTLVVAGAKPAAGSALGYDLSDPNALIDVDRYAALNAEVEGLLVSAVAASSDIVFPLVFDVLNTTVDTAFLVLDTVDETNPVSLVGQYVTGPIVRAVNNATRDSDVEALAEEVVYDVIDFVDDTRHAHAKEPNTAEDNYGGRALFGGVGDRLGSYNDYTPYLDAMHLYHDAMPVTRVCGGLSIAVAPVGFENTPYADCLPLLNLDTDMVGAVIRHARGDAPAEQHGTGTLVAFDARVLLWKDVNRDSHIGGVCNPNSPGNFDAARNTCTNAPEPWPHSDSSNHAERFSVCDATSAPGSTLILTPVGASWPNVLVLKNYATTTRLEPEFRDGREPIILRWNDACSTIPPDLESVDALFFPEGGSTIPIRVESRVDLPSGFKDADRGIDVEAEYVIDVDVLPANL